MLQSHTEPSPQTLSRRSAAVARGATKLAPGIVLCIAISLLALATQALEEHLTGRPWLEALVIAILLGTIIRTAWAPGIRWQPGIHFSAKPLLEIAVVALGASISFATVLAIGPAVLVGIAGVVTIAIAASYAISRALGLNHKLAILVACGNSICGNSAIAAIAPIIDADSDDVASSIAFTAVLGVVVVLCLPLLMPLLGLTISQYGALAGLTVYAVPQVIAATVPVGGVSSQVGTLVKLVRVLMLGPVVLALSLVGRRARRRLDWRHLVPWFILGFLGLAAARSLGLIPQALLPVFAHAAGTLTVVAMAALGLGVDVRTVARAGVRCTSAVVLSLVVLIVISLALIFGLHMA